MTSRVVEVACTTGSPGRAFAPSPAIDLVIRSGPGRNTAAPNLSDPVSSTPILGSSPSKPKTRIGMILEW